MHEMKNSDDSFTYHSNKTVSDIDQIEFEKTIGQTTEEVNTKDMDIVLHTRNSEIEIISTANSVGTDIE